MSLSVDTSVDRTMEAAPIPDFASATDLAAYAQFFGIYAGSDYGVHHALQPLRYSAFGCYDRGQMVQDLGQDVHPIQHMPMTEQTFRSLVELEPDVSPTDYHIGRLAALIHDIGECTHPQLGEVLGDIPQDRKTDAQRAIEHRIWDTLLDIHYRWLPDDQKQRIRSLVTHQENTDLHACLEAAHDINTLRVGVRAGRIALNALEQNQALDPRLDQLRRMGVVVTRDIIPRLERHTDRGIVMPGAVLMRNESMYNRIQSELADSD